ncbi:MAG: M15 family metallopeptidase [Lachnospiraceae bacterium]|nr:M15 family metallopeptidase [Lachnospiraceae bacterium]
MRKHKRKRSILPIVLGIVLCSVTVVCMEQIVPKDADVSMGWNLILVNRKHSIPDDWEVELTELTNGEKVDSRIYPKLQEMFNDARASGLGLFVADGYRTESEQREILDEKIREYENDGHSRYEAKKLAKQWVAVPGTSEHQLGISVDINADTSISSGETVYKWLAENSYKYGFINRYPADKTEITGTIYEPWHYRYVGEQAAMEIYSQGLCLEEYLEQISKYKN